MGSEWGLMGLANPPVSGRSGSGGKPLLKMPAARHCGGIRMLGGQGGQGSELVDMLHINKLNTPECLRNMYF